MTQRQEAIQDYLKEAQKPMNGQELADLCGVTRQIIVQDIALLRAQGAPIASTNRGYLWKQEPQDQARIRLLAVNHGPQQMAEELFTIIDHGGRIKNVLIDHPVYGEIQANLEINSRKDIQQFLDQCQNQSFVPLSSLTHGLHYHLVEVSRVEDWEDLIQSLKDLGIYQEEAPLPHM